MADIPRETAKPQVCSLKATSGKTVQNSDTVQGVKTSYYGMVQHLSTKRRYTGTDSQ